MTVANSIQDDATRQIVLDKFRRFEAFLAEMLRGGDDFTLRLEVHGNKGEIVHCRVYHDEIRRPPGVEKRVDSKR